MSHARLVLGLLANRALEGEGERKEEIRLLAALWDERLERLSRIGRQMTVSPGAEAALAFLESTAMAMDLGPDDQLAWLDAYPDAVADLFPPSVQSYFLVEQMGQGDVRVAPASIEVTERQPAAAAA
jgi:hypothetical protein